MKTLSRLALPLAVTALLVGGGAGAAQAATTPTPVPSAAATPTAGATPTSTPTPPPTPSATPTPTAAATPTPTPTPTATQTPPPTLAPATVVSDPTLAEQNAAHDHSMGSTIPEFEPGSATGDATTLSPQGLQENAQAALATHVLGMDVSGWQPTVDWNAAWANGGRFVYIKATESNDYTSSHFAAQYSGATAVGMIRGAYHFANPHESTGAVQANYFVNNGGGWSADGRTLPPMLDIEYDPYAGSDGTDACYGLNSAQMVAWIADFSNTVLARTGIRPTIYTTTGWWKTCTGNNGAFGANPLFIARWPQNMSDGAGALPNGWNSYAVWQYADAGVFPGDQDLYNGDYSALRAFASNGTAPANGTTLDSNYITALYHDYLGRVPSASDIVFWENALADGAPRSDIAAGFVNSDEYRLIRIDAAYRSVLGRNPDPGGRLSWLDAMHRGGITTDDIETQLYGSAEYYQAHGNTDSLFVASLYSTLLHRQGTASDYAFWSALITQHGRYWVIAQYWNANETISQRVSAMYTLYLGRAPDADGLQSWVNIALQIGDSGLRSGFTSSNEYFARSQNRRY
ncbi:GH25 family lysozyme [Subtercola sp. YIM 133946]|uniref:GH25 family lysozyme n=1 Tax=Subtercola sp. YIM 133946 TaxID=3118909 RepID=UPI002F93F917